MIESDQKISVYRNWFQGYTPETITEEMGQGGFFVENLWSDLKGKYKSIPSFFIFANRRKSRL